MLLDVYDRINAWKAALPDKLEAEDPAAAACLLPDEIRDLALEDRRKRAKQETFKVVWGDMYKGEHLVETMTGRQYLVTLHDPAQRSG